MPLQGRLKEMSLANLVQVNCEEMRAARISLAFKGQKGEVYFSDGQVVHAVAGSQTGEEALYTLLMWEDGAFTLETDVHAPDRTIRTPWSELLLEGMKRAAEWQATERKPDPSPASDLLRRLRAIDGVTGAVIAACDGVVLDADMPEGNAEREAAVAVFVGSAAGQIQKNLKLDPFTQGIVTMKNKRMLVLGQPDRFIGLLLADNTSPAIVGNKAADILGK